MIVGLFFVEPDFVVNQILRAGENFQCPLSKLSPLLSGISMSLSDFLLATAIFSMTRVSLWFDLNNTVQFLRVFNNPQKGEGFGGA